MVSDKEKWILTSRSMVLVVSLQIHRIVKVSSEMDSYTVLPHVLTQMAVKRKVFIRIISLMVNQNVNCLMGQLKKECSKMMYYTVQEKDYAKMELLIKAFLRMEYSLNDRNITSNNK